MKIVKAIAAIISMIGISIIVAGAILNEHPAWIGQMKDATHGFIETNYQTAARQYESEVLERAPNGAKMVAVMNYAADPCGMEIPRVVALANDLYEQAHPREVAAEKKQLVELLDQPWACSISQKSMDHIKAILQKKGLA